AHCAPISRAGLKQPALVVAVDSDRLFYPQHMAELAAALPGARPLQTVHSAHGHDGFLIENNEVSAIIADFLAEVAPAKIAPVATAREGATL
ncbi:hypothetical protein R6G99_11345, partial [Actinotignum timonense]|nr:hypothetical protein [Actinotignum timonense]